MKRRDLFRAGAAIAIAGTAGLPVMAAGGRRVSIVKGDPGERLYAEACGDGKSVRVFLDGVEQRHAETADEAEGFVDRCVTTAEGNIAWNRRTGEILKERAHGRVEIVIA